MEKRKILIVDDDANIAELIALYLTKECFQCEIAEDGETALEKHQSFQPDLILLDIMLPGIDGYDVLREIRKQYTTPVIMLSAKGETFDKVLGLELGADDYITKPFSLSVLRARVNTQLRKAESLQAHTSASVYRKGCYEFDFERMIFLVDGQEIELSKTEQRLLRLLVQNEGINLRRDFLLDRVWNDSAEFVDANALSVSVKRLRDKLGIPDSIKTVYGIGYRFE